MDYFCVCVYQGYYPLFFKIATATYISPGALYLETIFLVFV